MDESTRTRALHEVFDGGDRDDGLDVHNRSAPNALVVSAEPLGWKGTARHPAWTPTRVQVCLFSGFQASGMRVMIWGHHAGLGRPAPPGRVLRCVRPEIGLRSNVWALTERRRR